jgi:hypothetical protein
VATTYTTVEERRWDERSHESGINHTRQEAGAENEARTALESLIRAQRSDAIDIGCVDFE